MNENYGTVNFNGKKFTLKEAAYADNFNDSRSGGQTEIRYAAPAIDENGNDYLIIWDLKNPEEYAELEDESSACNWDNPAYIVEL